jgi:hypothetical protein
MMNPQMFEYMMGSSGGGMMFFGWLSFLVLLILAILGIIALAKYISKS